MAGELRFLLINGENLPAADTNGKSDPYVVFNVEGAKKKSNVKYNTLNPLWNESFDFPVKDKATAILSIKCFDEDGEAHGMWFDKDDALGECSLKIAQLPDNKACDVKLKMKKGHVYLLACFTPHGSAKPEAAAEIEKRRTTNAKVMADAEKSGASFAAVGGQVKATAGPAEPVAPIKSAQSTLQSNLSTAVPTPIQTAGSAIASTVASSAPASTPAAPAVASTPAKAPAPAAPVASSAAASTPAKAPVASTPATPATPAVVSKGKCKVQEGSDINPGQELWGSLPCDSAEYAENLAKLLGADGFTWDGKVVCPKKGPIRVVKQDGVMSGTFWWATMAK